MVSCPYRAAAHPRSRGENRTLWRGQHRPGGSSPLTRGKRGHVPYPTTIGLAHPRSRGENPLPSTKHAGSVGSSPLTRGKLPGENDPRAGSGLIPAHAGKTPSRLGRQKPRTAHPRSRGENSAIMPVSVPRLGSSPLTRGKHFLTCAFTAQIDQILETLELAVSFGSYSIWVACATDAPQDQVRSIGLVLPSSRGAS